MQIWYGFGFFTILMTKDSQGTPKISEKLEPGKALKAKTNFTSWTYTEGR